jgi:uncharacterized protein YutE (UPF0331/DUF86 family)
MTADEARAQLIRQNLAELEAIPQGSLAEFQADPRNLQATLHLLQTAIQALIDIGSLCASLGLPTPKSSHEIFTTLEADRRLPRGTADRLASIVGFRNRATAASWPTACVSCCRSPGDAPPPVNDSR